MQGSALLMLKGSTTDRRTVPAEVLLRTIDATQHLVWLLAAAEESRKFARRFNPDQAFRRRFTLELAVPTAGSYVVPMRVAMDQGPQEQLFLEVDPLQRLHEILAAVLEGSEKKFDSLVSVDFASRILGQLRKLLPRRGDGWWLGFSAGEAPPVELKARELERVEGWLRRPAQEHVGTIIGQLLRIDFGKRMVELLYPPTNRLIECSYLDEVEETLLEGRREKFAVTGRFVLGPDGHPSQMIEVSNVVPIDLSPIELDSIELKSGIVRFEPPLLVTLDLDEETSQTFVGEVRELNLVLSGRTLEEVIADLCEQMDFVLREYVDSAEDSLADDALALRRKLKERIRR